MMYPKPDSIYLRGPKGFGGVRVKPCLNRPHEKAVPMSVWKSCGFLLAFRLDL